MDKLFPRWIPPTQVWNHLFKTARHNVDNPKLQYSALPASYKLFNSQSNSFYVLCEKAEVGTSAELQDILIIFVMLSVVRKLLHCTRLCLYRYSKPFKRRRNHCILRNCVRGNIRSSKTLTIRLFRIKDQPFSCIVVTILKLRTWEVTMFFGRCTGNSCLFLRLDNIKNHLWPCPCINSIYILISILWCYLLWWECQWRSTPLWCLASLWWSHSLLWL